MPGHSKWSTIKRQKGANDAKRQPGSAPPGQFIRHVPRRAHGAFQVFRRNLLVALKG